MMRRIMSMLAVWALAVSGIAGQGSARVSYRVQLIRATDVSESLPAGSSRVGSELAGILHGPLKWQHYWNVCERKVVVVEGRVKRVPLINGREVEVDLSVRNRRTVAAFQDGKLLGRTAVPAGVGISLIGGKRYEKSDWFVAVQRDTPID
jgi:hypothetical protein